MRSRQIESRSSAHLRDGGNAIEKQAPDGKH
jgi:hypothetical protein